MAKQLSHRPRVDLDARGRIETHGNQLVKRGVFHDTESHDAAGIRDLEGIVRFWQGQGLGYGAHLIIDKAGNSALCANPEHITWAVARRNTGSFHIELIGFARFTPKLWRARPAQLEKLARWMAWLNYHYEIPLHFGINYGWSGHRDQPNQTHTDPGRFFPRTRVLRRANELRKSGW